MSTIESQGGAADQIRRNRAPDVQLPGVTGRLETPGLAIAPPVSESAQTLDGLLHAFSSLGGLSAQIVHAGRVEAAEAERRAELEEKRKEEIAAADRGQANIDADADLPELVSRIDSGEIRPEEGESVRDFVQRVTLADTDTMSDAYREQRRKSLTDNVSIALQRRLDRNKAEAQAANAALVIQSIDGAVSPGEFDAAVSAVRKINPNINEEVAIAEVGQRWLDNAVAESRVNPAKGAKILAAARAKLGDRMSTEQLTAQSLHDSSVQAQQNKVLSELDKDVGKMLDAGAPYQTVLSFIAEQGSQLGIDVHGLRRQVDTEHEVLHNRRAADRAAAERSKASREGQAEEDAANRVAGSILAGDFDAAESQARTAPNDVSRRTVLSLVDQVEAHRARAAREANQQYIQQTKLALTNEAVAGAASMVKGGLGNLIQDSVSVLPDGTEHKISHSELRETAMMQEFARIVEANPDDRDAAQSQMIQLAARNAYFPGGWKSLINDGGAKITTAAIAASKDGKLPADALQGYDLFKKMTAQAPGLLDSMGLSGRTKELFTAAMELEKVPMVGSDPNTALSTAANIVDDPTTQLDTIRLTALSNSLDLESQRDRDIAHDAAPIARILARLNKTPEVAVSQAIEQVRRNRIVINGWSARIGNVPPDLKYQFADVAEEKMDAFAATMEDAGIDKNDLAFRYNSSTDLWEIVMRDTGISVPTADQDTTFFSTNELVQAATQRDEKNAKKKYLERQRRHDDAMNRLTPTTFLDRLDEYQ